MNWNWSEEMDIDNCTICGNVFCAHKDSEPVCGNQECLDQYRSTQRVVRGRISGLDEAHKERKLYEKNWQDEVDKIRGGGVYFVMATNGLIKIGIASNFKRRLKTLGTQSPVKLSVIHVIRCKSSNHSNFEEQLHDVFDFERHHGEWFNLTQAQIEWIRTLDEKNFSEKVSAKSQGQP